MKLRPYQEEAVDALFTYFEKETGNPLIVLPTGTGKSLTQAAFAKRACDMYPGTNILLLTHVKELIQQDARAIVTHWPEAPIGIWSASVGRKDQAQITVAGIQSIHKYPAKFGNTDLVLIDEAHLVSKSADTMYGRFLAGLRQHNEYLKVIGFTATHYRLDSGLLTEGDGRIFSDIAYEYDVGEAIKQGYLCPLVSKGGVSKADLSKVHTRAGDFKADELAAANDHAHLIEGSLDEIAQYAHNRKHVLVFSAGIEHGAHIGSRARRHERQRARHEVERLHDGPHAVPRERDASDDRVRLPGHRLHRRLPVDEEHRPARAKARPWPAQHVRARRGSEHAGRAA
jgi:DNA repair protein RadD